MGFQTLLDKLTPTYQRAIRITSGLLPSTPGDAACAESGKLPFRYYLCRAICHRAINFDAKTAGPNGEGFLVAEANRLLNETTGLELPPVSGVHWCGTRGWNLPRIRVDLSIKNQFRAGSNPMAIKRAVAELLRNRYANHTVRYSDGSLALGRIGIGVAGPDLATCYRLPDQCTIFSAEAAAAFIAASSPADQPIAVFTDSASVVTALQSDNARHPWIQQIQSEAPPDTTFVWIPGHSGIPGNEEADHLAALGRRRALFTKLVPASDLKSWTSKIIGEKWANEWYQSGRRGTREFFLRKIKADTGKWDDPKSHREQRVVSRLRTGHTRFAYNMDGGGNFKTKCVVCHVHQSVEHVLCNCPQYEGPRERYGIPGSIRDALGDDPTTTAAVLLFLRDTGLDRLI